MRQIWKWIRAKRWRTAAFAAVLAFPVFTVTSVEVTSQPGFCNSCHIMEPYYSSWKVSAHKDVSCVKCHISPGATSFVEAKLNGLGQVVDDVLNRTSTKPSASVTQLSCTRSGCHTVESLSGKTIDNGRFKFRHDKHVGHDHLGVAFTCGTCHSHVQGDDHFEVNTDVCFTCHMLEAAPANPYGIKNEATPIAFRVRRPTPVSETVVSESGALHPPNECITCHNAPTEVIHRGELTIDHSEYLSYGASCESCHHGATATPLPITDGACLACHTFGIDHSMPAEEMHKIHAEGKHKIECFSCHGMVQHGPAAQVMSMAQFDCQQCHINEHSIQQMAYLAAPEGSPGAGPTGMQKPVNPMFMAHVDCSGCHTRESPLEDGSRVIRASAQACDTCHKPGMGEQTIPLWQDSTKKQFAAVQELLARVESNATTEENKRKLAEAVEILGVVQNDGSWGVHNPTYTQNLLERARARLTEIGVAPEGAS